MKPILDRCEDGSMVMFWCPGCQTCHGVWLRGHEKQNPNGAGWDWNGDMVKPTFAPSILVRGTKPITDEQADRILAGEKIEPIETRCHSFVRDGRIEYLTDCTHDLAGKTVDLEPAE